MVKRVDTSKLADPSPLSKPVDIDRKIYDLIKRSTVFTPEEIAKFGIPPGEPNSSVLGEEQQQAKKEEDRRAKRKSLEDKIFASLTDQEKSIIDARRHRVMKVDEAEKIVGVDRKTVSLQDLEKRFLTLMFINTKGGSSFLTEKIDFSYKVLKNYIEEGRKEEEPEQPAEAEKEASQDQTEQQATDQPKQEQQKDTTSQDAKDQTTQNSSKEDQTKSAQF